MIDREADRRYLLGKTQHRIGGFGKFPGVPPGEFFFVFSFGLRRKRIWFGADCGFSLDILHSALALACLAVHGEVGLKAVDPVFCVSVEVKARFDGVAWKRRG